MAKDDELSWGRSTVETSCPLDCPDNCSLAVSVEKGRVVKIDASPRNAFTDGYICAKVRNFADRVYGDDRLLYPAVRTGPKGKGQFKRVSWDEALAQIAAQMLTVKRRSGAEAVLPFCYGGSNGLLTQDTNDAELFRRFGASRLARTVCAAPSGAAFLAMYGKMGSVAYEDYPDATLIVLWGANPSASSIHLVPHVREAQKRGAKLVVVDPRRTVLARHADLHIALRPGTDLVVALAIHRHLFEQGLADTAFLDAHTTGAARLREKAAPWTFENAAAIARVDPKDLERFATLYAESSPAVVRCGWGLERNRNGGHASLAVLALPAVGGKFGVRGGGYSMSTSASWGLKPSTWVETPEPPTRTINMNHLGQVLLEQRDPGIELLFVYNCNPVATMPDQNAVVKGLLREDLFTVVFDQVRTDTAMYADVILPATTFLEHYEITKSYGAYAIQLGQPAIEPVGESRSNMEVFSDLLARLDLGREEPEHDTETLMRVFDKLPDPIRNQLIDKGLATPAFGPRPIQFVDLFPQTADGKIHLFPENLPTIAPGGLYAYQPDPATERYPLALISPASEKTVSSTLGELRQRPASLYMHIEDAVERGLKDGDPVRIYNDLGEVHCLLITGDAVARGTVSLAKGLWRRSTLNHSTSNALSPSTLSDLGGGACFNDARVEVARLLKAAFEAQDVAFFVKPGSVATDRGSVH